MSVLAIKYDLGGLDWQLQPTYQMLHARSGGLSISVALKLPPDVNYVKICLIKSIMLWLMVYRKL